MKPSVNINILIIDDHPLNIDAYKNLTKHNLEGKEFNFIEATSCEEAYNVIKFKNLNKDKIDYAFIDYNLPSYSDKKIFNGLDLSIFLKKKFKDCKIVFITMHNEPAIISSIVQAINPDGLISKSDVNFESFKEIINTIFIQNGKYRSSSIVKAEKTITANILDWDEYDYKIVELLVAGEKTKNLTKYIPLSLSAIEKRKATIKKQLLTNNGNDTDLIIEIKKRGLL
ncbi:response regulator [Flavobacterium chuncheonense]|uniref:Response regulator n=1 Tax=Flavobacterium chuncheonense TaxID=2026653 RepID=A0ABW5YJW4_9FLAO